MVMILISAGVLFYQIRIRKRSPEGLLVNQITAAEGGTEKPAAPMAEHAENEEVSSQSAESASQAPVTEENGETGEVPPESSPEDLPDDSLR